MRLVLLILSGLLGLAAVTLTYMSGESRRVTTPRLRAIHSNVLERKSAPADDADGYASPPLTP